MITCSIRMRFDGRRREEAVQVLRGLLGPVRSERGCRDTRLLQETAGDGETVSWISRWQERRHLEKHLNSQHFRRILAVMEIAAEAPVVGFDLDSELRGFDLIEEVLGPPEPPGGAAAMNQLSTEKPEAHQGETS